MPITQDPLNQPNPRIAAPKIGANVMHFARLLRRAGLPVGPGETIAAQRALSMIDIGNRTEARTALASVMVHRHEHQEVFDLAFRLFWRAPAAAQQAAIAALLDPRPPAPPERAPPASRRVAEALASPRPPRNP